MIDRGMIATSLLFLCTLAGPASADDTPNGAAQQRAETLMNNLVSGAHDKIIARFDDNMRAAISRDTLGQIMDQVKAGFGDFERIARVRPAASPTPAGMSTLELLCKFSNSDQLLITSVTYHDDGRIAGLSIRPSTETEQDVAAPAGSTPNTDSTDGSTPGSADDDAWSRHRPAAEALFAELTRGEYDAVEARFDRKMKAAVPAAKLKQVFEPMRSTLGAFKRVASHRSISSGGADTQQFELMLEFESAAMLGATISYDAAGAVSGLYLRPSGDKAAADGEPMPFADYQTQTKLSLPGRGEWTVYNGGRDVAVNHHVTNRNQRYAYDLVITRNGRSYRGDGKRNEDYYAYGQPVVAPAPGKVVQVVDGIPDNDLGMTNHYFIPGNLVVIDHGHDEFSFLAHFKPGTIKVSSGDKVERGQLLGDCGNSGNSSEPHIHYHLQNAPRMQDGDGLPAPFRVVLLNGEAVEIAEPERNDRVAPANPGR